MKSSSKLSDLTLTQLTEKKKKLTSLLVGITAGMMVVCGVLFYLIFKTKNYILMPVGMGALITLIPVFTNFTEVNNEIKKRQKQA
ncbi:hypothetical protein [Mucilaginibacter sp. CSA2-8R]|uniref:hypothetical protein n=1 Tax=Mucilaginibacter sp. CSA2-8R TaxID=3141542 RepID=UPI00315D1A6F